MCYGRHGGAEARWARLRNLGENKESCARSLFRSTMTLEIDFSNLDESVPSSPHPQQRESAEITPNPNKRPAHRASLSPAPALLPIRAPFNPHRDAALPPAPSPPARSSKPKSTKLATKFQPGPSRTIYDLSLSQLAPDEPQQQPDEDEIEQWGEMPPPSIFATGSARAATTEINRSITNGLIAGVAVTKTHSRETQPEHDDAFQHPDEYHDRYGQLTRHSADRHEPTAEEHIQFEFDSIRGGNARFDDVDHSEKRAREEDESEHEEATAAQRKKDKKKRKKNRRNAVVSLFVDLFCTSADSSCVQPQQSPAIGDSAQHTQIEESATDWTKNSNHPVYDHHSSPDAAPAYSHQPQNITVNPLAPITDLFPGDLSFLKHADALVHLKQDSASDCTGWESCTEAEWMKGGDELVERFTKLTARVAGLRRCAPILVS